MKLEELKNSCLGRKKNKNQYLLEKIDIISPYLSEQFIDSLIILNPKKVIITTDAACSPKIIENIRNSPSNKVRKINVAYCDGIVHAKCYLFHWKNKITKKYKRLFLWGSCNATKGGFERNAEVYSWINLSKINKDQQKTLLKYFRQLRNGKKKVSEVRINLNNGVFIRLPNIRKYDPANSSFDYWIQKGKLCHPFPNDPSFRHLRLTLKNKMRPQNEFSDVLSENNIDINQQATISYDYLRNNSRDISDFEVDDNFTSMWKAKYFIDTVYGLWTSEDCFNDNKDRFHKSDDRRRKIEIKVISEATKDQREEWCNKFIDIIKKINSSISNPREYFHYIDGELDVSKYRLQFDKQLNRDFLRSKDRWFKHGYISGYDFPEVPPMREFTYHWKELVMSFSESLFFEINKKGTINRLAQTVRDNTDIGHPTSSDNLLQELNINWDKHKEFIECFYCEE